jgi:hypothetical protein
MTQTRLQTHSNQVGHTPIRQIKNIFSNKNTRFDYNLLRFQAVRRISDQPFKTILLGTPVVWSCHRKLTNNLL